MQVPIVISNRIPRKKQIKYKEWWNTPIEPQRFTDYNTPATNGIFVKDFYSNTLDIIKSCGYKINKKNILKNEIATIIYTLSDDTSNGL